MGHHYIESGLDNVWLDNGFQTHSTPYGEGMAVDDVTGLHKAIGHWLISRQQALTGAELRFLRIEMELTQRNLAAMLGVEEQAVRRWEKTRRKPLAGPVDRLVRAIYSEWAGGDGSVRRMIARLAEFDQAEQVRGRFVEGDAGWMWV